MEDLAVYIDWHRAHPHCDSPRAMRDGIVYGSQMRDEEDPTLIYTRMNNKPAPLPKMFVPNEVGRDCDIDEVSTVALTLERQNNLMVLSDYDDPWYNMSVQDHLEQSHIDGSHTTVKFKRKNNTKVETAFDRNLAWQKAQYGNYEGGFPELDDESLQFIDKLSLQDKTILHNKKKKQGPWEQLYTSIHSLQKAVHIWIFSREEN